jgi:hypothetical protein
MANKNSGSKNTRPGSLTVTVSDAEGERGVLSGAFVSVQLDAGLAQPPPPELAPASNPPIGAAFKAQDEARPRITLRTDKHGQVTFTDLDPARYAVTLEHYVNDKGGATTTVDVGAGCADSVCFALPLSANVEATYPGEFPRVGDRARVKVTFCNDGMSALTDHVSLLLPPGATPIDKDKFAFRLPIRVAGPQQVTMALQFARLPQSATFATGGLASATGEQKATYALKLDMDADERESTPIDGTLSVSMKRSETEPTADLRLWGAIRTSTEALSFDNYLRFMDGLFCGSGGRRQPDAQNSSRRPGSTAFNTLLQKRFLPFTDTDAYRVMKAATEAFVMVNCAVVTDGRDMDSEMDVTAADYLGRRDLPKLIGTELPYLEEVDGRRLLPYLAIIRRKLPDVPFNEELCGTSAEADLCNGFVQEKLRNPCLLELIWSYWHEEGLQVQTMNAITRRFQNLRGVTQPDPLANMEVNPLRPLNSLLWGYIQDEQHRLTVARRNGEYSHHYGLALEGRAVRGFRPADTRSRFIEAFHHLLRLCTVFYKRDDNTNIKADAFGVLNALKEVHLVLSQGAHCQFGDLPPTARIEMLMQQWLLSRPEFREFLPTRVMVAYPEPWMDRVDAMKKLQGWTDTSVMVFHNLAVFGEQLLLAIRYGNWGVVYEPTQAFNFARYWRPQVQGYIHAYRAATGVELGAETVDSGVDATLPSTLLQRRQAARQRSV